MYSFQSKSTLKFGGKDYEIYRLDALDKAGVSTTHLPFSLRILLENLLRTEDGRNVKAEDIRALAAWNGWEDEVRKGNCVYTQPGADAGFYRRSRRGGFGRHARRYDETGRRSRAD
jgi:hypothetical protein